MTEPIYHVTQEVPCRFCKGVGSKCYVCKGSGVEGVAVTEPVSVLVWTFVSEALPADCRLVLLAFRSEGVVGVDVAWYKPALKRWYTPYSQWIEYPIAYAELTIPAELAEVTP